MIRDLIARLEKATGPDRELDADIWEIADPKAFAITKSQRAAFTNREWTEEEKQQQALSTARKYAPRYTESIDSAVTLVPKGCATSVDFPGGHVTIFLVNGDDFDVDGATPALAICIAAMKARAWKE